MDAVNSPLISVILPTYNGSKYLREALDSVFAQTHTRFEVIIIDNGSVDDTLKTLSEYHGKLKVLSESRKGVAFARNTGIANASGDHIAFIDQDDIWLPDKLKTQLDILLKFDQIGMVGCSYYSIDGSSAITGLVEKRDVKSRNYLKDELFVRNFIGPPVCMLIRKDVLNHVGLFDTNLNGVEDKDLWFRILNKYDLKFSEKPLIKYRIHSNNAHKNVPFMKASQKGFIQKHCKEVSLYEVFKARGYVYLDAAREYFGAGERLKSLCEIIKAVFTCPLPIYSKDDKWQLLVKIILPLKFVKILSKNFKNIFVVAKN